MSNNKQSEEEINKIDVQSAADQQENTNADSKKANWRFGAVGNIVKQHLDREGMQIMKPYLRLRLAFTPEKSRYIIQGLFRTILRQSISYRETSRRTKETGLFWMFCLGVKMLRNQAPVFSE